jgi:ribosome-binding protein aMBF1 (putative translation factor)
MQAARMELKLSQKDVAQKINEKPSILQDYESGKAIPNPQILGKLERVLQVKLRGACFIPVTPPRGASHSTRADIVLQVVTLGRSWTPRRSRNSVRP